MPDRRRVRALVLGGVLLIATAACADDGGGSADGGPTPSSGTGATSSSTSPSPSPTSEAAGAPRSAPAAAVAPAFSATVEAVTVAELHASWRPGCPHPVEQLRAIDATHWGYDGKVHEGRVVVDAALADGLVEVLRDLFVARFPIERMVPIDEYGGSDEASTAANNTSAFNCRPATGGSSWSEHAYGRAIDVNPLVNPYVRGDLVLPPDGAAYVDRTRTDPGLIHDGDPAVTAFAARGWRWGGHWQSLKDYQHFSPSGR